MSRPGLPLLLTLLLLSLGRSSPAQTPADLAAALSNGDLQHAVSLADNILKQHPNDPQIWTLRAVALERLKQPSESLSSFRHALDVSPNYLPALEGAAQLAYSQHDPSASKFLHRILANDSKNAVAHAMLGVLAAESHDCPAALNEFAEAGPFLAAHPDTLVPLGNCQLIENRPAQAVDTFRRIVAARPNDASARYKLALSLRGAGKMSDAITELKTLPPDSKVLDLLADCYVHQQNPDLAMAALRQAIQISPKDEQNYVDLGQLYIERKQPGYALELENQGLRYLPQSARLYTLRGAAYTWLNESEHAARDFEKADQLEPEQLYGSVGLSMLLRQNQNLPQAIEILRAKLAERPSDPTLNYLLADTLVRTGAEPGQPAFREAVSLMEKSVALDSQFQKAHVSLGKLYLREAQPEQAIEQFQTALQIDPHDRSALTQLLLLFRRTGKTEQADAAAHKLKELVARDQRP